MMAPKCIPAVWLFFLLLAGIPTLPAAAETNAPTLRMLVCIGICVTIFKELNEVKDTHCKLDFLGIFIVAIVLVAVRGIFWSRCKPLGKPNHVLKLL